MKYKSWKSKKASYYYANDLESEETIEDKFTKIYNENLWEIDETKSGVASQKEFAINALTNLQKIIKQHSIKSILDVPCGDLNWIKPVWGSVHYHGIDIVPDLIDTNEKKYREADGVEFSCMNVLSSNLPSVDLIFCRDLFIHLSNESVMAALENFSKSNSKYLLTTSYSKVNYNDAIQDGDYRPINLEAEPFNFIEPIHFFSEPYWFEEDFGRGMGLWELK